MNEQPEGHWCPHKMRHLNCCWIESMIFFLHKIFHEWMLLCFWVKPTCYWDHWVWFAQCDRLKKRHLPLGRNNQASQTASGCPGEARWAGNDLCSLLQSAAQIHLQCGPLGQAWCQLKHRKSPLLSMQTYRLRFITKSPYITYHYSQGYVAVGLAPWSSEQNDGQMVKRLGPDSWIPL